MVPMSATESLDCAYVLQLARQGVREALSEGDAQVPDTEALPVELQEEGACFVTLESGGQLRGCIGSLYPRRMLGADIKVNACHAALHDPRFQPLPADEPVRIIVSVLSPLQELYFADEHALVAQLRPNVDGVLLCVGVHQGTFLPSVWDSLPEPEHFLAQLKRKAGLAEDYWSESLRAWRYTTQVCAEQCERSLLHR